MFDTKSYSSAANGSSLVSTSSTSFSVLKSVMVLLLMAGLLLNINLLEPSR